MYLLPSWSQTKMPRPWLTRGPPKRTGAITASTTSSCSVTLAAASAVATTCPAARASRWA